MTEQEDVLTPSQRARVEALKVSQGVLAEKTSGPMSSSSKAVDTIDLVNIASWIIDGKDPWRRKTTKDLPGE